MTRSERASQIWAVLAWVAKNRQTLTYGHLSKLIGVPTAGLGQLLEPIQSYCLLKKLPPLTILVVQQDSGLPGAGFTGTNAAEYAKAYMKVYECDWLAHDNPQPEKLEQAVQEHPSNGAVFCWHHKDLQRLSRCLEKGYCDLYPIGPRTSKLWKKLKVKVGEDVQFSVKGKIKAVGRIQSEPYDLSKIRKIQPVDPEWPGAVDIESVRFLDGGTCRSNPRMGSHRL